MGNEELEMNEYYYTITFDDMLLCFTIRRVEYLNQLIDKKRISKGWCWKNFKDASNYVRQLNNDINERTKNLLSSTI